MRAYARKIKYIEIMRGPGDTMTIPEVHDPEEFRRYVDRGGELLADLEKRSRDNDVPIIGSHIGNLLYLLARATNAARVLELGTANGYSTIWIAKAIEQNMGRDRKEKAIEQHGVRDRQEKAIVTVEWEQAIAEEAARNISTAGYDDLVEQRQGDARVVLDSLERGSFDLIFIDIEKEYYSELLNSSVELLRTGGLLVFDNTAFKTAGDFLERSADHPDLQTVHFYGFMPNHDPEWDAVTLAVKK